MTITPSAKRATEGAQAQALAQLKDTYRRRIQAIQAAFAPALSNAELSAGMGLPAGRASAVGRFVSQSGRLRGAVPDRFTRALIDRVFEGECVIAAMEGGDGGREVLVCEKHERERLGPRWRVGRIGKTQRDRAKGLGPGQDWEDPGMWEIFGAAGREEALGGDATDARASVPEQHTVKERTMTPSRLSGIFGLDRHLAGFEIPALGMGCMRLSNPGRPPASDAVALLHAALDAGVRFLDTADVYGLNEDDLGHNERLVRQALETWSGPSDEVLVATKVGMTRKGTRYLPVGKAGHILEAGRARLEALGVDQIDLLQLHLPDPKVKLSTSARALAKLKREGVVRHVGLCNVSLPQLLEAQKHVEIACVQVGLNIFDVGPLRSGLVEHCAAESIPIIAHSPVGGHRGVRRLVRDKVLAKVAVRHGVSATQIGLAWLMDLVPNVVVIPGTTRSESLEVNLGAVKVVLTDEDRDELDARFSASARARRRLAGHKAAPQGEGEVVIVMGYPAAGKTSQVAPYVERGYERLNRDELGGRLKDLLPRLEEGLSQGKRRFIMDNTYPTRASRAQVLEVSDRFGVPARCVWLQTSEEEASVNATLRMVSRHGGLLGPEEISARGKEDANLFGPGAQLRYRRTFEAPSVEEGFAEVEEAPFLRRWGPEHVNKALILDYDGTLRVTKSGDKYPLHPDDVDILPGRIEVLRRYEAQGYLLLGASNQSGVARGKLSYDDAQACLDRTNELLGIDIEATFCPHPSGPPVCWCRKPLPGLGVALVLKHKLDPAQCIMVGDMTSDAKMAARCGFQYFDAEAFFAG